MKRRYLSREFLSGALFVLIGLAALAAASRYPLGTPRRMGPGMFPIIVGSLMVLLGGGVAIKALLLGAGAKLRVSVSDLRPLGLILLAIAAFALLADRAGLVAGLLALGLAAQFADGDTKPVTALVLAVVITALVVPLFVWGLGVPFDLWPR